MWNKKPRCKGAWVPRPITFLHGFLNGRFKTAGVDQETQLLNSAYIHGQVFLYGELCKRQMVRLECKLSAAYTEAGALIAELAALPAPPPFGGDDRSGGTLPASAAEAQCRRLAGKKAAQASALRSRTAGRRQEILIRLLELRDRTASRERICTEELEAAAEALKSRFCTYGHGVLLKPVRTWNIPEVDHSRYLENYRAEHDPIKRKMAAILDREEHGDV